MAARSGKAILAILAGKVGGKSKPADKSGEEMDDDGLDEESQDGDGPDAKYQAHAEKIFPDEPEKQNALIDLIHACMDEG